MVARVRFICSYRIMEDLATAAVVEEDKLVHEEKNTKAFLQDRCLGVGTLNIRER